MAIFKRRDTRSNLKNLRETLWPSMGWVRTFHYYRHRVFRTGDSTYKITAGLASGAAVSWSPFIGTHFIQALFLSWLLRANLLAGFTGTIWGNPWTFPFMFWISYGTGTWICALFGLHDFTAMPTSLSFAYFLEQPREFFGYLFSNPLELLLPLTLGGYVCGILFWFFSYGILYYPVRSARKAYLKRKRAKKKK